MPFISKLEQNSTPICRCRVLYLGSAVPHVTKDGLQGIQEPLRELYPEQGALGARGIDSWLSVWSNGLLLENVDENHKKVTRFFPIDSLHYCAAVRYVLVPEKSSVSTSTQPRFLPLDSPFARSPNPTHPPLFAAILRRTTGIKVLECHTFICKREAAANALVRCCFHAYADSSYVKQIEVGGNGSSLYGTLCNGDQQPASNSIDKVEGWRRLASSSTGPNGSSLTLNSTLQHIPQDNDFVSNLELSNSADDLSIYNGDENHKVWVGSTRDISMDKDPIYGEYGASTMRSSRSNRPRQDTNAPPPPPPPPPKDEKSNKRSNKERSKRRKPSEGYKEDMHHMYNGSLMRPHALHPLMNGAGLRSANSVSGGTIMRGYPKGYSNGTILRPAPSQINGFHPIHGPPLTPPMMVIPTTLPHPPRRSSTGTFSHRPKPGMLAPVQRPMHHHLPPNFIPMPPQPIYVPTGRKLSKHNGIPVPLVMEEPIYMPSARPLSPTASYQPGHFPHEAYLMQQYALTTTNGNTKSKKKNKSKSKKEQIIQTNGHHHHHHPMEPDEDEDEGDSIYNTGIYRKKGHLNERAFSYSIRQEHRSRSYGSLSNLKFAPPPVLPNNNIPPPPLDHHGMPVNKQDIKKEREIMQMMQDLDLSGDELERSEVPPSIYQQNRAKASKARR